MDNGHVKMLFYLIDSNVEVNRVFQCFFSLFFVSCWCENHGLLVGNFTRGHECLGLVLANVKLP